MFGDSTDHRPHQRYNTVVETDIFKEKNSSIVSPSKFNGNNIGSVNNKLR